MAKIIPKYLMMEKALPDSLNPNFKRMMIAISPRMLKMRKGIHWSCRRRGLRCILIDQTCEYMATPMMMAALMIASRMYPT